MTDPVPSASPHGTDQNGNPAFSMAANRSCFAFADALQDAGCDSDDILNHCRQPSDHVRGCWVVDLLLGKA